LKQVTPSRLTHPPFATRRPLINIGQWELVVPPDRSTT
jgi:hypothetical protein